MVLVWDWPAAGDSQGFHVYRSGALAQTVSQSSERVAILPPASPGKCYSVRAFKGNLESEPSDNLCTGDNPAEPSQVAFGPAILLAYARAEVEQGLGSSCLLPHKTWTIASAEKVDGASQPASVGFRHSFGSSLGACEKQTNLVLRAHVVYDISSLIGRHVSGAVLKTTLTSSLSTQRQDVGAPQAVSSDGCATGLYGADYAPGETALNPSQPIGSYPQGGPVDVTAWVQSQVAGAKQFAAFVLSSNEAYARNFDACLSAYLFNELSVTLSP